MNYKIKVILLFYSFSVAFSQFNDDRIIFIDSIKPGNSLLPQNCGNYQDTDPFRISNGKIAKLGEFPWMALLQFRTSSNELRLVCGGFLINNRYVVTAAHCVTGSDIGTKMILEKVRLGEYNFKTDVDCGEDVHGVKRCVDSVVYAGIEEAIPHEKYIANSVHQHYDIALLRLDHNVTYSDYIKPVCLVDYNKILDTKFTISGWGQTGSIERQSEILRKAELMLSDRQRCQAFYRDSANPSTIINSQICAESGNGQDTCRGDSGTPLMQLNTWTSNGPRWEAVGLTSYGPFLCGGNEPAIYTDVRFFKRWIESKLRP